jgi:hypothetical protein
MATASRNSYSRAMISTPAAAAPRERLALAGAWLLILAPVVAHGLWRPLLLGLGAVGDAGWISFAALGVALVVVVGQAVWPARSGRHWASACTTAILAACLVGGSPMGIVAAAGALTTVALLACFALPAAIRSLPIELEGLARQRRVATVAMTLLLLAAVAQTTRLSIFMGDPDRTDAATKIDTRYDHHSCFTAYVQAAKLADARVDNLYDAGWWPAIDHSTTAEAQAEFYAPFDLDTYAYPPQFLLLPRLLLVVGDDFSAQRAAWFGLDGLCLAFGLWCLASWIGETNAKAGIRALAFAPVIWLLPHVFVTLQVGNAHMAVTVMAMLGMVAFDRGRPALGGALLAFAILSKISPGLLGVVLLAQRRWRDALWTAGFGLGWTLLALIVFGPAPFQAFVFYELPRLDSGAALEFFTKNDFDLASNMAPFGVPFKLEKLGIAIDDVWAIAAKIGLAFTVFAFVLSALGGYRTAASPLGDRRIQAGMWLAVLTLGALRSPFAPPYVSFSALWLLSLWVAEVERGRQAAALTLVLVLMLGMPLASVPALVILSLINQATLLGMIVWFLLRPQVGTSGSKHHSPCTAATASRSKPPAP